MDSTYIPDKGFMQKFFRTDNRLNRKRYLFRALGVGFCSGIVSFIMDRAGDDASLILLGLLFVISIALIVSSVMLMIRRLHDLNRSGWFFLVGLVPLINFIFGLYLLFAKGTEGQNRFGADPLT